MIQLLDFFLLYGSTPQALDLTESKSPSFTELLSLPRTDMHPLYIIIQKVKYLSQVFKDRPIEKEYNLYVETFNVAKLAK
jgi:hypothetical protein